MLRDETTVERNVLAILSRTEIDDATEEAVRGMGEEAIRLLLRVASGDATGADAYQRGNAIFLIGRLGIPQAAGDLDKILERESGRRIRLSALMALGRLGGAASRKTLLRIVQAPKRDRGERVVALRALAEIGERDDADALRTLQLDASHPTLEVIRQNALAAIDARAHAPTARSSSGKDG